MQKQRAAVFLFFVSVLALTLQGCAVKRWLFEPRSGYIIIPPEPMPESPPAPAAASAPSDAPVPLQWDFAQRADQEKTAEPPQVAPQTATATSPQPQVTPQTA